MTHRDDTPTVRAPGPDAGPADDDDGGLESRVLLARARSKLLGRPAQPVHVGRYRILDRLGQGGMGVVYLAQDDELDRKVAIKILRQDLAPSSAGRSRLLREAQATAKLSHPNVVHVYEVGHESDQVYMAMEYVAGDTLRRWAEQPRAWRDVVAMYVGAGEALAAAHAVGLVHRDFKPDNVLVGRDGRPRVVVFGRRASRST
jgi:serine/threonine protein kinase